MKGVRDKLRELLVSLAAFAMAMVFATFFMRAKHDPVWSTIIPFADDPVDAVGSFALIAALLLGAGAVIAAVVRCCSRAPSEEGRFFLGRTQAGAALAVLVALGGDAVLMARHPARWWGRPGSGELCWSMVGVGALAWGVVALVRWAERPLPPGSARIRHRASAGVGLLVIGLGTFPEQIIASTGGELLALGVGAGLLFVTMAVLLEYTVPGWEDSATGRRSVFWSRLAAAALVGAALGGLILLAESHEGTGISPERFATVAGLFVGAPAVGLAGAFLCLGRLLGLDRPARGGPRRAKAGR